MHPAHAVLAPWISAVAGPWRLPSADCLNAWQEAGGESGPRFAEVATPEGGYEPHIATHGVVPTRPDNWHDAFNALCWLAWPQAKRAINQAHCRILAAGGEAERRRRSPARDVLTLLDEGGAVVLCADPAITDAVRARDWPTLFVGLRPRLRSHASLLLLGHASLDELRAPRLGLTGKCLLYAAPESLLRQPLLEQRAWADARVANQLSATESLGRGRDYAPLPLLGWPGWHPQGEDPAFYAEHRDYFRGPPTAQA